MTASKKMLETAAYHFSRGDVDLAMLACREVCKQKNRPNSRIMAARMILDHERDLSKHENPKDSTVNINLRITDSSKNGR